MIIIFKNPWSRLIDRKQILWSGYWLLSDKYPQSLNMHQSEDLLMARVPKEGGEFPLKLLILLGFHCWEETLRAGRATCTHTHTVRGQRSGTAGVLPHPGVAPYTTTSTRLLNLLTKILAKHNRTLRHTFQVSPAYRSVSPLTWISYLLPDFSPILLWQPFCLKLKIFHLSL